MNGSNFDTLDGRRALRTAREVAAAHVASLRNASAGHATEITVPQQVARVALTAMMVGLGALLFASQIGATLH